MASPFTSEEERILSRIQKDGIGIESEPGRMTDVYCARPEEICPFFEQRGFQTMKLLASEGMFADVADEVENIRTGSSEDFERLWEVALEMADEPSILGAASHLLYVGRKKEE